MRAASPRTPFSIQSISKLFTLTLALRDIGPELWKRIGREPSGSAFNSLLHLEYEDGKPRNPFINAGALVVTDALIGMYEDPWPVLRDLLRRLGGNAVIDFNAAVARSEAECGFRNASLANFLKSYGRLDHGVEQVLDLYYRHCALEMSCIDLARAGFFLMNQGVPLGEGEPLVSAKPRQVPQQPDADLRHLRQRR